MDSRQQLRRQMRQLRNTFSPQQQHLAATALLKQVQQLAAFKNAQTVALYLAADGEIGTQDIIQHCWNSGRQVYLPVLDPQNHHQLLFVHYQENTPMHHNKYAIAEPALPYQKTIQAQDLELVLLPLVAFDDSGARMGMGGGYYDRSFAFKAGKPDSTPLLLGLAHQRQQVTKLSVESWDIPLQGIVTDHNIFSSDESCNPR